MEDTPASKAGATMQESEKAPGESPTKGAGNDLVQSNKVKNIRNLKNQTNPDTLTQ